MTNKPKSTRSTLCPEARRRYIRRLRSRAKMLRESVEMSRAREQPKDK